MSFITIENFDINKVVLGDIYSNTKPVPFQVVPIQYKYTSSYMGDLIIQYKYTSSYTGDLIMRTPKLRVSGDV